MLKFVSSYKNDFFYLHMVFAACKYFRVRISDYFTKYSVVVCSVSATTKFVQLLACKIIDVFRGKVSIFLPFLYYRFITLRYMSRRNDATRLAYLHFCAKGYHSALQLNLSVITRPAFASYG